MKTRLYLHAFRILVLILAVAVINPSARAAGNTVKKVALVIGNQRYGADHALPNAANDARLMGKTLASLGFSVTERSDLTGADFTAAVTEFADRIPEGATAFVYYAGHGMQVGGSNYLNPVDMQITSEQATPMRAYPLNRMLDRLARSRSAVNIVVLDACRNNPFRPRGDARYRSFADLGLSRVEAPRGTLIAYSTAPGQLASDGKGANSIYTAALAHALLEPGREIEEIFKQVGDEVRRKTLDDQIPWVESSLTGSYYFKPPDNVTVIAGVSRAKSGAGSTETGAIRRGSHTAGEKGTEWYRQLTAAEWSQIDWEIQQRVKRMTPDEIPALEHKASAGNVLAQTTLGLMHREGIDKAVDSASGRVLRFKANNGKALRWLMRAAEAGFPVAQAELGEMYYTGHGLDRNLQASRAWLERAASANYPRAKLDLLQVEVEIGAGSPDMRGPFEAILKSITAPATSIQRP